MKFRAEVLLLSIIILISFMLYVGAYASEELLLVSKIVVDAFGLVLLSLAALLIAWVISRIRMYNHQVAASLAEAQVRTVIVKEDENLFIRDQNPDARWHNTAMDPRPEIGRNLALPTETDNSRWYHLTQFKFISRMKLPRGQMDTIFNQGADNTMLFPDAVQGQLPPPNILDILSQAQRALIVGPSNAGKTTLLNHYIQRKMAHGPGEILVIDPHAEPTHWRGCKVVGIGSNHAEITDTLDKLIRIMEKRYEEIGTGLVKTGHHAPICVIIDEWMSIANMCKNASQVMVRLLTESRKAAFSVIICSHSQRIKSLGLTGQGDLKEGFTVVKLALTNSNERSASIDLGDGVDTQAVLPGPYHEPDLSTPVLEPSQTKVWDTLLNDETLMEPTDFEQAAFDQYEAGESLRTITTGLYGDGKYGKHYNIKFINLCERFDIPIQGEHRHRFVEMKTTPYEPKAEAELEEQPA